MRLVVFFSFLASGLATMVRVVTLEPSANQVFRDLFDGVIVSPGYLDKKPYPHNFEGSITLHARKPNERFQLDFEDVDLDVSAMCKSDRIQIMELVGNFSRTALALCSSHRPNPWLSRRATIKINFRSDRMLSGRGFRIRFRTTNATSVCDDKSLFQCGNRYCIPNKLVCNGQFDCTDASDEVNCTQANTVGKTRLIKAPCGKPTIPPMMSEEDRVVGGQEAVPHSWPWQVSLQLTSIDVLGHFCGGSLIDNTWVVTAGHCVKNKDIRQIVVKLGAHSLMDNNGVVTRKIKAAVEHPRFVVQNMNYDIALLQLDMPVNHSESVRPICLPEANEVVPVNATCFSSGWGETRGSGGFAVLKQIRVEIKPFQTCKENKNHEVVEDTAICAGDPLQREAVCHGDSGGPLACQNKGNSWVLHGATSLSTASSGLKNVCGSAVFWNRVQAHRIWIDDALRSL